MRKKLTKMIENLQNKNIIAVVITILVGLVNLDNLSAQNSMTGDGFGGRSWYKAHNYQVGAYSGYTVCDTNSQLYGWGHNEYGELGNGNIINTDTAVAIIGMNNVKFYTTGYISAVIKNDNTAWVWGKGAPISPITLYGTTPSQILSDVKFVDAGSSHVVFVKNDGTVWASGVNSIGQLGNGSNISSLVPVQMTGINNAVRAVALGYYNEYLASIILLADGSVKITGGYQTFSNNNNLVPATIAGLNNIVDIKGGATAVYALNANGEVYSFGKEINVGQYISALGLGGFTGAFTPPTKLIFPSGTAPIIALSANNDGYHGLCLDENGNIYGWGSNFYGTLGIGTNTAVTTPQLVATNVIDMYAGEVFSYMLKSDSTLWATGGYSPYGSIWMNQTNIDRNVWTPINPTIAPMNLCAPKVSGVFPLQLLRFTATALGSTARLAWQSGNEQNFSWFVLEYSSDGKLFEGIATSPAKGSNSNYNYEHRQVSGTAFYRLKMIDKDGSSKYSEIRSVRFSESLRFTISPNPTNDVINIYSKNNTTIKSVQVLSISGKILLTINGYSSGQPINLHGFAAGTYLIKTIDKNGNSEYGKVMKL